MCGRAENKSDNTIGLTTSALRHLERFLSEKSMSTRAEDIGIQGMRAFMLSLRLSPRFQNHPYIKGQTGMLSSGAIDSYLRAIRAAWNRWFREDLVERSPFDVVRLPRVTKKVMRTFTQTELTGLFAAPDTKTAEGFRDHTLMVFIYDTICRLSEATSLGMADLDIQGGYAKVLGKGRRKRHIFFGIELRKLLWKYVKRYRPEPQLPIYDNLFLTADGRPLSKNRVQAIVKDYCIKAGITGDRLCPHTLRHTSCLNWVRDGGDLISLQGITGH